VTLKCELEVFQGHWNYNSKAWLQFSIRIL